MNFREILVALSTALFFVQTLAAAELPQPAASAPAKPEEKADEQLINELFVGEKIYLQDKGEFVLVLSPSFSKGSSGNETELSAEVKYGLTSRLQISAEFPYVFTDPKDDKQHDGIGDMSCAVNYNFLQKDEFALGARLELVIPTGNERRDLGGGELVLAPSLLASVRVGKGEIYAGIGGEFGEHGDAFTYSIAGAYPWERFVGVLELTGVTGDHEDTLYVAPGVYWHINEKIDLGVGVPIGLTHDSDDYRIVVKAIFEF